MNWRPSLVAMLGLLAICGLLATPAPTQPATRNLGVTTVGNPAKRIALVIGNDGYHRVEPLRNARADARAIAQALEGSGFDVILRLDAGEKAMKEAMRQFKGRIGGGDEAVFYFSGHGVQLGAANYLLPTDINVQGEDQIKDDALPLQRVLDDLQDQKARFSLAIIDACRNNPFRGAGRSIGGRGLAPTSAATGQMVLFSAGAGQQALDRLGDADHSPHGLFTRIFLKEMDRPGVPVDRVLRGVREEVVRLAKSVGHDQVPALYDQALGEFYFRPPTSTVASFGSSAGESAALELALWNSVKDSGQAAELTAYLDQYPKGSFAAVARSRLDQLKPRPPATSAPSSVPPPTVSLAALHPGQPAAVSSTAVSAPVPAVSGFPSRPLRLVVPFAPGGSSDIVARSLGQALTQRLGQPVLIDNRPGAAGMIGIAEAVRSPADGYTLLLGNAASISSASQLNRSTAPNPLTDLQAVAALGHAPLVLVVPANSRHTSVDALLAEARRQPGAITYASSGNGSIGHVAAVALEAQAAVSLVHIPYRGTAPAMADLLAGAVNLAFLELSATQAQIAAGKLRALAITGGRRSTQLAEVPTLAQSGVNNIDLAQWTGIFVPAGTPANIVAHLAGEIRRATDQPEFFQRLAQLSMSAGHPGNGDFASFVREDVSRMAHWIKVGKLQLE